MVGLLVSLTVMGLLLSALLPVWSQVAQREKEAELIFRGEQYARAVELYQRKYAGALPPDIQTLLAGRFLRRWYSDPMTDDGEFEVIYQAPAGEFLDSGTKEFTREETWTQLQSGDGVSPQAQRLTGSRGGVIGVVSRSDTASLRVYRDGTKYSEWAFVNLAVSGSASPGVQDGVEGQTRPGLLGDDLFGDEGGGRRPSLKDEGAQFGLGLR